MSLCPKINISPCNIIGDKDNISIKIAPRMVEDVKKMYGIDLENKKLLMLLKEFGSIKIAFSEAGSLINSCQTEDELAREDEKELKEAQAELALEEKAELKEASGHYYPYSYEQVESWVNVARSYICDVANGMNSKETKRVLLKEALEVIDLLRAAFKDSKETLNSPEFRIKA